jgi:tyrosine-protein phosphatase YwqE
MKRKIIDVSCNILYGVDDGPLYLKQSLKILQDVSDYCSEIILTPRVNSYLSTSTRQIHYENYERLKQYSEKIPIRLHLSSEIYIPKNLSDLPYDDYTFGNTRFLFLRFSPSIETDICDHIQKLIKRGYRIILSSAETYSYLTVEKYRILKSFNVYFQVAASSLIHSEYNRFNSVINVLMSLNYIDFVGSNIKDIVTPSNTMFIAYQDSISCYGKTKTEDIFYHNAKKILLSKKYKK